MSRARWYVEALLWIALTGLLVPLCWLLSPRPTSRMRPRLEPLVSRMIAWAERLESRHTPAGHSHGGKE